MYNLQHHQNLLPLRACLYGVGCWRSREKLRDMRWGGATPSVQCWVSVPATEACASRWRHTCMRWVNTIRWPAHDVVAEKYMGSSGLYYTILYYTSIMAYTTHIFSDNLGEHLDPCHLCLLIQGFFVPLLLVPPIATRRKKCLRWYRQELKLNRFQPHMLPQMLNSFRVFGYPV